MGSVAAEVERDPTAEPDIAASTPGSSMLERWIESGDDRALKRIDVLVKTLDHLRAASIRMTYPSDWIIHTSTDADGNILRQVGYLQDCGADRAGKAWGIQLTEPSEEIERFPENKTFAYRLKADAWSKVTGERLERVLGSRWSGDKFFTRGLEEGEQVDPTDVAKAAYANLHGRAVRALAGLGAVPLDVLKAAGLDVEKVMFVGYSKGSKGGQSTGAGVGTADFVISWGNSKGKRPAEISDKDLAYYIRKAEENLADPSKQRFKQKTEHELAALRAETERRAKSAEQETETGTKAPARCLCPDGPAGIHEEGCPQAAGDEGRGAKLGALQKRLHDALGKGNQRALGAFLRLLTADPGPAKDSLSELTDQEIERIGGASPEALKSLAAQALKESK